MCNGTLVVERELQTPQTWLGVLYAIGTGLHAFLLANFWRYKSGRKAQSRPFSLWSQNLKGHRFRRNTRALNRWTNTVNVKHMFATVSKLFAKYIYALRSWFAAFKWTFLRLVNNATAHLKGPRQDPTLRLLPWKPVGLGESPALILTHYMLE